MFAVTYCGTEGAGLVERAGRTSPPIPDGGLLGCEVGTAGLAVLTGGGVLTGCEVLGRGKFVMVGICVLVDTGGRVGAVVDVATGGFGLGAAGFFVLVATVIG